MNFYGVCIDHAKAYIIKANEKDIVSFEKLLSGVEGHRHSGIDNDERLTLVDQKANNERRQNEFHHFCTQVMGKLSDADDILIFGHGDAKKQFFNECKKHHVIGDKIVDVE